MRRTVAGTLMAVVVFSAIWASWSGVWAQDVDRPIKPITREDGIMLFFSPESNCGGAIIEQIKSARAEILLQIYSFSSREIADALIEADERGVDVQIIFDYEQSREGYSKDEDLARGGCKVWYDFHGDKPEGNNHNKVMIIDRQVIITGSYNFSTRANDVNSENLLMLFNKRKLVHAYRAHFEQRKAQSRPSRIAAQD